MRIDSRSVFTLRATWPSRKGPGGRGGGGGGGPLGVLEMICACSGCCPQGCAPFVRICCTLHSCVPFRIEIIVLWEVKDGRIIFHVKSQREESAQRQVVIDSPPSPKKVKNKGKWSVHLSSPFTQVNKKVGVQLLHADPSTGYRQPSLCNWLEAIYWSLSVVFLSADLGIIMTLDIWIVCQRVFDSGVSL